MQQQIMNFLTVLIVAQPIIVGITLLIAHRMVKAGKIRQEKSEQMLREHEHLNKIMQRWAA